MSERLRLALVTETWPPELNGVAMTVSRLAEGLRNLGHSVQVIRPRQQNDSVEGSPDVLVRGLPLPGYKGLQFGLPATGRLRRLWEGERPHVVHAVTEGPLGWSALRVARALRIPVTSSYHTNFDGYSKHYGAALMGPLVTAWLRRFHRRTLTTLAPTRALVDTLLAAGVPHARLLGRGVDTTLFHPGKRNTALRSKWGAAAHTLVVTNIGRLAAEKNLMLAARAFEAIEVRHPGALMVWVGDGPSREALSRRYPHHIFTGPKRGEELARHYASADLFLFPSLTETYGNVVPEAMASGVPVVAYDTAAAAELIDSGESGITVAVEDESAFIDAARQLAGNAAMRQGIARAARLRVEPVTWESIVREFENVLQSAARGDLSGDAVPAPLVSPAQGSST